MSFAAAEIQEEVLGKAYDARLMRRLLGYLRPYRRSVFWAIAYLVAGSGLSSIQPYLTGFAIDRYIQNRDVAGLNRIAIVYVLTLLLVFLFGFLQMWLINIMGQKIMYDLRMQIVHPVNALRYFAKRIGTSGGLKPASSAWLL